MTGSKKPNVWLFVPNLIGYIRVLLLFVAFWAAEEWPWLFAAAYALSELLDSWDGYAARTFGQCSRFGAVLDMVTDRCSTAALIVILVTFYPSYAKVFAFLIALDLTSHYAHLYSSLSKGLTSHKQTDENTFTLLRLYYSNKYLLYVLCFGNEQAFVALYLLHHFPNWHSPYLSNLSVPLVLFFLALPVCAAKQFMNLLQLAQAARDAVAIDQKELAEKKKKDHSKQQEQHVPDVVEEITSPTARSKRTLSSPSRSASSQSPSRGSSASRRASRSQRD